MHNPFPPPPQYHRENMPQPIQPNLPPNLPLNLSPNLPPSLPPSPPINNFNPP